MNKENKFLIVIAGPTAVGKTTLALTLAQEFKTEIISADSRQLYKEMTIGTAKPSAEELAKVPHHFINHLSIHTTYTAGIFEEEALAVLDTLFKKHNIVILTGGSGLYIKALCEGIDDIPLVDASIRIALNQQYAEKGVTPLLEELHLKDPIYFQEVDKANPIRLIRALEVCRGTNQPYSFFRTKNKKDRPFTCINIALKRERDALYKRIDLRVDQMLGSGLLEEAKSLYKVKHLNALQTVGYNEPFKFFDNLYSYEEMTTALKQHTRNYAKRQLTWFNKNDTYTWFDPEQEETIINFCKNFIKKASK